MILPDLEFAESRNAMIPNRRPRRDNGAPMNAQQLSKMPSVVNTNVSHDSTEISRESLPADVE